jgi:hypothetical protein
MRYLALASSITVNLICAATNTMFGVKVRSLAVRDQNVMSFPYHSVILDCRGSQSQNAWRMT